MRSPEPCYTYREPIHLRMGVHAGDVLVDGSGDIFGDGVNIAARLQAEAEAGGVLASRTVASLAGGSLPFRLRPEGVHSFKNIAEPIETLSVDFTDEKIAGARRELADSQQIRVLSCQG